MSRSYHDGCRAKRWNENMAVVQGEEKAILEVDFDIEGQTRRWTCWLDSLLKDGQPSANLRGLLACGVTMADVQAWQGGGTLEGLDRRTVTCVVEQDKNGYDIVKYVNDPDERPGREVKPIDRRTKAVAGQQMLEAMRGLMGSAPPPSPAAPTREPTPFAPPPSTKLGFCAECGAAKVPSETTGEAVCPAGCIPF